MAAATGAAKSPRLQEIEEKLKRIRSFLKVKELGGVVLSSQALFAWATAGGDNHVVLAHDFGVAFYLVTPSEAVVMADTIEINRIRSEEFAGIQSKKIEFWTCPWYERERMEGEIARRTEGKPWASDQRLPGSAPLDAAFDALTYSLTAFEIERYRKLGKDCSQAMEEALTAAKPGMTEHEVAGLICKSMFDRGVRPHLALVASDERIHNFRHPIPTGKKVKKHLMGVLCGKRGGLIINLTRIVHFGKMAESLRHKHDACIQVDGVLNTKTRPGIPVNAIFEAGVAEYEKHGFGDDWTLHHQGGPTGYQGRSFVGRPSEKRVVLEDQAFAWNPSITGTKSEDTILASSPGIEFLSAPTRNWPTVAVKAGGKSFKRADIWVR